MTILDVIDEDFVNYKKPVMTILCCHCSFKCDHECGRPVCQNSKLAQSPSIHIDDEKLVNRYISNKITKAICFQGLEPLDSFNELIEFIIALNKTGHKDEIVIYTGYNKDEIESKINQLHSLYSNLIIKYGRYVPDQKPHYDEILGVYLASDNQYAERL